MGKNRESEEIVMNKKCQVFTPENYVRELLDSVGYTHNLYGKKILENSCGDGNILVVVVQRYIDDCRANGLSRTRIKNGLEKDIYGFEIDGKQHKYFERKESDKIRDGLLKKNEFIVYRIEWNEINSENGKQLMKTKIDKFLQWYNNELNLNN